MSIPLKVVVLLALVFGAYVISPETTRAASCYGSGCEGQNPYSTGCAQDSYGVGAAYIQSAWDPSKTGIVYVKWSPSCQTNWGELLLTSTTGYPWMHVDTAIGPWGDQILSYMNGKLAGVPGNLIYTAMLYAPSTCVSATGIIVDSTATAWDPTC